MLAAVALFVSLGLDTFAVAVGLGVKGLPRAQWRSVGLTFALFEGLMPVLGLLIGRQASASFGYTAHYSAAALLIAFGAWEIREALLDDDDDAATDDPAIAAAVHLRSVWITGLSVSLDELAVGFSLGVVGVVPVVALPLIGLQAFGLTFLGLALGKRLGARLGERAELAAGVVLLVLGVAMLF